MPAVAYRDKVEKAIDVFQQLNENEKMAFWEETRWQLNLIDAKRLDASVIPNEITMEEIVADVREVRRERAEKRRKGLLQWKE